MGSERAMLRGALIPTSITAVISIVACTYIWDGPGAVGAILAQLIVVAFFASNLLVARITRDLEPMMVMALAMVSYMTKVILLGLFLFLITTFLPQELYERKAFGVSAVAATFAWLGGEIVAFLRLKLHLQLPQQR
jgi:ATP synthase protein I